MLLLTARDSIEDRVTGLDAGADDYLVKPFAFEELLARLRVLLRKPVTEKSSILNVADLSLHVDTRRVFPGGQGAPAFLQGVFPASLHDAECRRRVKPG